ncbi:hypothetical protein ARMSODRAFT_1026150 [Armillaria solidipes]|uniref:Uncharacterized protein n=1 Tax=Armillaria solidipes TaxID=1076256 RepID=A0A2H3APZ7_9AGAR|nr:hypothetical protein ARMSODRAFT_1026150 [Armillaria solidipes]
MFSSIAAQADIPPDLTDVNMVNILQDLDAGLNSGIFYSLLHGVYTGFIAITLGNILMNKSQSTGRAMVMVIGLLHIFTTINFAFNWSFICSTFVNYGQSVWTRYLVAVSPSISVMVMGATSLMCTILADSTMIWRCWMVWGRRWLTILLPVVFLVFAMVFKAIAMYKQYTIPGEGHAFYFMLYSCSVLATTLWCTSLIIYRIIATVRAGVGTEFGLRAYRHVIEILVESSALYSISLTFYVAFYACGNIALNYFDVLAAISRGIAPTLLVGRVAAGHAHPDDSWEGSVMSSLRFEGDQSLISSREDTATSVILDLEAQGEINDEYGHRAWMGSQGEESIIRGNDLEAQMERQDDDPNVIVIVPKDL